MANKKNYELNKFIVKNQYLCTISEYENALEFYKKELLKNKKVGSDSEKETEHISKREDL